jgi:hypothetical protein
MAGPCGTFVITGVPADQADTVKAEFQLDNPTSVTVGPVVNGMVTVTAVFPPCAGGANPVQTTSFGS